MNTQLLNTSYDRLFSSGIRQLNGGRNDSQPPTTNGRGAELPLTSAIERGYAALGEGRSSAAFSAELVIFRVGQSVGQSIGTAGSSAERLDTLAAGLRGSGSNGTALRGGSAEKQAIPTPEKVAGTILGFVEKGLAMAKANGASDEKLDAMLQQARAGVNKGYEQAREELQARGFLPDESGQLEADIDSGYASVIKGLDRLGRSIADNASVMQAPAAGVEKPTSARSETLSNPSGRYEHGASLRSERSEISLKTRDGDIVKLSLSAVAAVSAELSESAKAGAEVLQGVAASRFMLDVEGDLDDGELEAINSFLQQIDSLANDFFAGDMQKAVEKAMALDVDMGEIANFAVNLTSLNYSEISRAYGPQEQANGQGGADDVAIKNQFSPLAQFVEELRASLDKIDQLTERFSAPDLLESSARVLFDIGLIGQSTESSDAGVQSAEQFDHFVEFLRASAERMSGTTG